MDIGGKNGFSDGFAELTLFIKNNLWCQETFPVSYLLEIEQK